MHNAAYQEFLTAWGVALLCRMETDASMASPKPQKTTRQNPLWFKTHLDLEPPFEYSSACVSAPCPTVAPITHVYRHTNTKKDVRVRAQASVLHLQIVQTNVQACTYRPQKCIRRMFPLHAVECKFRVSQQPVGAATFSYDRQIHSTHFQPQPGHILKSWPSKVS